MPNLLTNPDFILKAFETQRVMVVGDLMLDSYVTGRANRISPEAPVPVLEFEAEENRLGGAANVALNLRSLGAVPLLCGVVGNDANGQILLMELAKAGIGTNSIYRSSERPTTIKTRIIAGKQQLLRLDKEVTHDLTPSESSKFLEIATRCLRDESVTALIFQDYNKGILTPLVIEKLIDEAKKKGIPIAVDPKFRNFWNYEGVDLFKPNLKEVKDALRSPIAISVASLGGASATIRERLGCKTVLITLSEHGAFLDDGIGCQIYPTRPRTVADVCGAGDTVISISTLAMAIGLPSEQVALLANLAGGQVVEKTGVVSVNSAQLNQELLQLYA